MNRKFIPHTRMSRVLFTALGLMLLLLAICAGILYRWVGIARPVGTTRGIAPAIKLGSDRTDRPAPMARWPWPHATTDNPHAGVKHWIDRSSPDGTVLELFDFDFYKNPNLRLELYDQDQDDQTPFDDQAKFWMRGVGQVTRHLNETGRGKVVAAWNGLFFQYHKGIARHVAPVVLNGKALYNVGTIRWAVGVKYHKNKPVFKVMRLPPFRVPASEYDSASEGASRLIFDGKPLRLQPFPKPGEDPFPPSKPPGPGEAGFVRQVDHIRTSRTSMAWSKNNRHFYLLIVKEPDSEGASIQALKYRLPLMGGWTVADEQRFWQQFGAWCAVNLDGGDVTQMTALRRDGRYDLVPPRWDSASMRANFSSDFTSAPFGGSLMYFFVRDTAAVMLNSPNALVGARQK